MKLMNWGCGPVQPSDWTNVDVVVPEVHGGTGVEVDLLMEPSPWPEGSFDGIMANHSVCAVDTNRLSPLFSVFYELLKPGGVLRVAVPDVLAAANAFRTGDDEWFPHRAACASLDEAFCTYFTWKSTNLSVFTPGRLIELFRGAGFSEAWAVPVFETRTALDKLVELDNRPTETIVVEGIK